MSSYPNVAEVNPDSRPLPPGWISQFDPNYRAWYYVDTTATPPKTFWQHPADLAPPPPPAYAPPSGPPPTGGAVAGGGVGGFAFPTPQGPTSPGGDGKIPTYGGNTAFPDQQVYPAAPGTADHKPAHVGAQYSSAPTPSFDTKNPSSYPTSPQYDNNYQGGQYGQNPDPYQSQYGQQAPGQYGQQPPAGSKGDKGGLGGLLGGIMGGKHGGGGSSAGKMGKLGALGGLAGLAGGKLAGGSGGSHGSGSSSPFGKLAGFAGGSHGGGSHGYGHGGYAAAPMMYGKPPKKKHGGMGGAGMLAAGAGAGLLGGLLVADAVDDAFDDDYGGGGFDDFGDF